MKIATCRVNVDVDGAYRGAKVRDEIELIQSAHSFQVSLELLVCVIQAKAKLKQIHFRKPLRRADRKITK